MFWEFGGKAFKAPSGLELKLHIKWDQHHCVRAAQQGLVGFFLLLFLAGLCLLHTWGIYSAPVVYIEIYLGYVKAYQWGGEGRGGGAMWGDFGLVFSSYLSSKAQSIMGMLAREEGPKND